MPRNKKEEIRKIFEAIFASQDTLRELAPEFKWKGMGNLLGDYGEFLALAEYDLVKAPAGSRNYDAITKDGKTVQIKANFSAQHVGFRGNADLLLVVGIDNKGRSEEIYFGPFSIIQEIATYSARDSKWMISINRLKEMNSQRVKALND